MIDVRIICAHDASKTANAIMRLLSAEGHAAEVLLGRGSLQRLEESQLRREAVLLIWSLDAASTEYMHIWAQKTDPAKLAEIARAPVWPDIEGRRATVVDFSGWSGERGGAAWRALEDRLRNIGRATEPKKPEPLRPALAMVGVGLAAAGVALVVRMDQAPPQMVDNTAEDMMVAEFDAEGGRGGAIAIIEPASMDDEDVLTVRPVRGQVRMIAEPRAAEPLLAAYTADPMEYRDPTLLDRLSMIASPLLRDND